MIKKINFDVLFQIMGAVKIDNEWVVDCAAISDLPLFSFFVERRQLYVGPRLYIKREVTQSGKEVCYSKMAESSSLLVTWILGHPFLKAHYSVFDFGKQSICFAPSL